MKKFAVGVIDFFHNHLVIDIVEAKNWKEALSKHSSITSTIEEINETFVDDQSAAKGQAFNLDMMFDVKEIE